MNIVEIVNIISSVGFPVVMCIVLVQWISKREKEQDERFDKIVENFRSSLDENTKAINNISNKLK